MEASEYLATVAEMHGEARRRRLFFQNCEDEQIRGRQVTLNGSPVLSFSSCSYLALEHHPALVQGVHDAVDRYGTQFSASRGYLSAPRYDELEDLLSQLFGGHALVTPTTTLGHQIVLPVLASEKDAIVLDHQVHYSVQMAATLARAAGTRVEMVRHSELEKALDLVADLAQRHRTVWFACDGVYSMYGDLAPVGLLEQLLAIAPNVRIYVDDAHGMSWAGQHGRGSFLSRMPLSPRIVVATSLNKAFSAAGGCVVFSDAAERERVRMCGGPMVFSGPIQPPMLGAALASARVHLSDEIVERQHALRAVVDRCNARLREHDLPLLVENESPIFFVRLGLPRVAFAVAERLFAEGLYVNVSMYPSVPMRRAGIRLALTSAHSLADVDRVIDALARHVPAVMEDQGLSREQLDGMFAHAIPTELLRDRRPVRAADVFATLTGGVTHDLRQVRAAANETTDADAATLTVERYDTIHAVDRALWDNAVGTVGACSWDAMAMAERLFVGQPQQEHNWKFLYVVVRGADGRPLCVTHFTESLNKDDMLMRAKVSAAVEARRAQDRYFLTSRVVMTGSPLSEGNHIYLDRTGPWRAALARALEVGHEMYESSGANMLMLRDLPSDDGEMDRFLLDHGFVKVPMLDSHHLPIEWSDDAGLAARLSKRQRRYLRDQIDRTALYEVRSYGVGSEDKGTLTPDEQAHLYRLYLNVATRKRRINVFELPPSMIASFLDSPAWEIVTLRPRAEAGGPGLGAPVAWYAAHVQGGHYAPFLCGLDYDYVLSGGAYRQLLYQIVHRATRLGMREVHMGMDADVEKGRYATQVRGNSVYVQVRDHFNGAVLRQIVEEVGVGTPPPVAPARPASTGSGELPAVDPVTAVRPMPKAQVG